MAVLPTPGSPTNTGLFFVRRLRIWISRFTSLERPTTGSNLFSFANFVKSRANESSVGVPCGVCRLSCIFLRRFIPFPPESPASPILCFRTCRAFERLIPKLIMIRVAMILSSFNKLIKICSVPTF